MIKYQLTYRIFAVDALCGHTFRLHPLEQVPLAISIMVPSSAHSVSLAQFS
jgi:hypothetical protein